jgi:hypothetical protein
MLVLSGGRDRLLVFCVLDLGRRRGFVLSGRRNNLIVRLGHDIPLLRRRFEAASPRESTTGPIIVSSHAVAQGRLRRRIQRLTRADYNRAV